MLSSVSQDTKLQKSVFALTEPNFFWGAKLYKKVLLNFFFYKTKIVDVY
jgi:hypothetical protein